MLLLDPCFWRIYNRPVQQPSTKNRLTRSEISGFQFRQWAEEIKHWGLSDIVVTLIEGGSAFSTLAAQSLHISRPFLETWFSTEKLSHLAALLEEPEFNSAFIKVLKEESP
jgi:hypothetical protein